MLDEYGKLFENAIHTYTVDSAPVEIKLIASLVQAYFGLQKKNGAISITIRDAEVAEIVVGDMDLLDALETRVQEEIQDDIMAIMEDSDENGQLLYSDMLSSHSSPEGEDVIGFTPDFDVEPNKRRH